MLIPRHGDRSGRAAQECGQVVSQNLVSFSRSFKEIYASMGDTERASVDKVLSPLTPLLKSMIKHQVHFRKMSVKLSITGPHRYLYVVITDHPIRATVKTVSK